MKKLLLLFLIFPCMMACANEVTEDYFDIATNYCTYGKYNDAMTYIDKILQIEPSNQDAKDIKSMLQRITSANSLSYLEAADSKVKQAFTFKKQGNKQKEIAALAAGQNDFWSNYFLAKIYHNNKDYKNAVSCYQKAISLKPNFSQGYLGLANTYIAMEEFQNAIDVLNKYISYNKEADIAYALRAKAQMNLNHIIEAQDDINTAINIDENLSYLLIEAEILYYKGDYENARDKLNLLSKNVQTSEVYKYIGLCDYALNDYSSALLNLDKAIILSDEDKSLETTYNDIKALLDKK